MGLLERIERLNPEMRAFISVIKDDGGDFRVRYSVDGGETKFIDKWAPVWLTGWTAGKHNVKLDLIDKDGNLVDNGGYNSTTREITVTK